MAGRAAPTARRLRVAAELRKLRERAGLTSTEAARQLGTSQGQLSNVEIGRFGVSGDRVRAMAQVYECADPLFVAALAEMAEDRSRGWWESYRGVLPAGLIDLAEVEHHGTGLRAAITAHIPGLLQTEEHAREVFRQVVPSLSHSDAERRLAYRVQRQALLVGDEPPPYHAIIHEAALRMRFGGPAVTRSQLLHLVEMGERPNITIQVIPFEAGAFPGAGQSIFYVTGPVAQLDTVHLDQSHGPVFLDAEAQLSKYRGLMDRMAAVALEPDESLVFIDTIAHAL